MLRAQQCVEDASSVDGEGRPGGAPDAAASERCWSVGLRFGGILVCHWVAAEPWICHQLAVDVPIAGFLTAGSATHQGLMLRVAEQLPYPSLGADRSPQLTA